MPPSHAPGAWLALALAVAVLHTLKGPDHYIPFIALRRLRGWSLRRTLAVTAACGFAHCAASLLLLAGALLFTGLAAGHEAVQALRGDVAAAVLCGLGAVLLVAGLRRAWRARAAGPGGGTPAPARAAGWWLFVFFVLGPCEWLIPGALGAYAHLGLGWALAVAAAFSLATVATMVAVTAAASEGLARLRMGFLERHTTALAGAALLLAGLATVVFDL